MTFKTMKVLASCIAIGTSVAAQTTFDVTYEKKTSYNGWTTGWDTVHVVKNGLITAAVVPKLGGRVMQYDLGTHKSLYIYNSSQVPADGNEVVGGFRMLPSPQSDFSWPSPPSVDFKPYTCTIRSSTPDSTVIYLESQIENSTDAKYQKHKGLQFKRTITIYSASTRVKVEMTMLNKGTQSMQHGIWDITQTACATGANCWVYFPRNPSSTLGGGKGFVQYMNEGTDATQWKPDAAEGAIMGVQYLKKVGKIGADCKAGWICFNDRTSGYAYVKTYTYQDNATYPDSGASVQVYTYKDYDMIEVEVLGPLVNLSPNDSTRLVENWFATRATGPVLAVSASGLVTKKMSVTQTADTVTITGTYGVFQPGKVKTQFCTATGTVVATADSATALPTDSLRIDKKLQVPGGAARIRLAAFDASGKLVGILDSAAVPNPVDVKCRGGKPAGTNLQSSVFRHQGSLVVNVPQSGTITAELFTLQGKRIACFTGTAPYCHEFGIPRLSVNTVVARITGRSFAEYHTISGDNRF